jgi:putative ABC transport system permease protein
MTRPAHRGEPMAVRLFRWFARVALPRDFYERYGSETVEVFKDAYRDAIGQSLGRTAVFLREFTMLATTSVRERLAGVRHAMRSLTRSSMKMPLNPDGCWRDLRHGVRMLFKNPGMTSLAVMAFALGIGSTATMFSISHGFLRDPPFPEQDRVVVLARHNPADNRIDPRITIHEVSDWREQQSTLEGVAAFVETSFDLSGVGDRPERVLGAFVTANVFDLLRARPTLGRGFREAEERPGADPVVVLGFRLWVSRYQQDPNILGAIVRVNGVQRTVVGVMPEGFHFPYIEDIWIPIEVDPVGVERGAGRRIRGFGRLSEGVSLDEAQAEFAAIARRLEVAYPEVNRDITVRILTFKDYAVEPEAAFLIHAMVVLVSFVLLVACANVANLLLARAAARSREVAVRTALGASRRRVVGQMLTEATVIAAVGGVLGLLVAHVGVVLFNRTLADIIPISWMVIRVDTTVVAFTFVLILFASLIAGTLPAWKASGVDVNEVLKDESRGASSLRLGRLSRTLVVGEVAFSCALLTVSGLLVKGVMQTVSELGFATKDVLTARVTLRSHEYPAGDDIAAFHRDLLERLEANPGVRGAAISTSLPGTTGGFTSYEVEGEPYTQGARRPTARRAGISPGYFATLGVSPLAGREFAWSDKQGSEPVALVNRRFADRHFPGEDPLGRRIRTHQLESESDWYRVVGIAPDMAMDGNRSSQSAGFYLPFMQARWRTVHILVRGPEDPSGLASLLRAEMSHVDPDVPLYEVAPLDRVVHLDKLPERTFGIMFAAYGLAGLFLATVGLYGVLAFSVRRRVKEIGIRMAMGAKPSRILWLNFKSGLFQVGTGLAVGLGLAALVSPVMREVLMDVNPHDPAVYGLVMVAMCVTGAGATLIPSARATRLQPIDTLRTE